LALTIIGIVFEEAFSLAYIAFAYRFKNNKNPIKKAPNISNIKALGILISTSAPLTLNRVTGSLLSSFENILIPQKLVLYGLSQTEAISSFGQVTGMTMPLIYFPSAFLISLSISLVPAISEDFAFNNIKKINYTVSKTLLFAAITGIGAACVFTVFAKELGLVIFKQDLSGQLILFSFMCPFLYIQLVLSGILNGLGYQLFLFKNSLIASFINIACVYLLVPIYGISGFIFGWFLSLVIICSLEIEKIHKNINLKINLIKWFILPSISASGTAILMNSFIKDIIFNMFNSAISLVVCLIITFIIYMFFITSTDCVSYEDISSLIFRNKLRLNQTD
jgi:stage V sporulation protein B